MRRVWWSRLWRLEHLFGSLICRRLFAAHTRTETKPTKHISTFRLFTPPDQTPSHCRCVEQPSSVRSASSAARISFFSRISCASLMSSARRERVPSPPRQTPASCGCSFALVLVGHRHVGVDHELELRGTVTPRVRTRGGWRTPRGGRCRILLCIGFADSGGVPIVPIASEKPRTSSVTGSAIAMGIVESSAFSSSTSTTSANSGSDLALLFARFNASAAAAVVLICIPPLRSVWYQEPMPFLLFGAEASENLARHTIFELADDAIILVVLPTAAGGSWNRPAPRAA